MAFLASKHHRKFIDQRHTQKIVNIGTAKSVKPYDKKMMPLKCRPANKITKPKLLL